MYANYPANYPANNYWAAGNLLRAYGGAGVAGYPYNLYGQFYAGNPANIPYGWNPYWPMARQGIPATAAGGESEQTE